MKSKNSILKTIALIVTLLAVSNFAFGCVKQRDSERILNKSVEKINIITSKKGILHEQYRLTFNDSFMDHTKDVYENNSGTVKIESPTFTLVRIIQGDTYYFLGHNTKNYYIDKFKIEKEVFEHHEDEINTATLLNSYISRGITMYTAYGPKSFWNKLFRSLLADSKTSMKTSKSFYEFTNQMDTDSKIKLYIDKKSLLPTKIILWANVDKNYHGNEPFKKVTLNVTKRDTKSPQKNKKIFDISIPKGYKTRKLLIKKHEHKHNTEEMGCTNCHTADISVTRYEKNRLTHF